MDKTGLVIGKFYPPHRGHKFLIDTARANVEHLTVLVCDKEGQTIPAETRAAWLREIHPGLSVRIVPDELADDDSQGWAAATIQWLGFVPDVVFTSEEYGDAYAYYLGCKHILVDKSRVHVPCSGTMIRANPWTFAQFLEPCVRADYVRHICVLGAESTGTTTLAQDLSEHYRTSWVPEYGRESWEIKMRGPDCNNWREEEFVQIAERQCLLEDTHAQRAARLLICDTNAFATGVWHERYRGCRSAAVEAIAAQRHYDLVFLTNVDIPFVQDGTRDGEHLRAWMHDLFQTRLHEAGQPFTILAGHRGERLSGAVDRVASLMALQKNKHWGNYGVAE